MQGFDPDKLFEQALKAAKENDLFFVADVITHLPCDKSTFYKYMPADSERFHEIKEILDQNKVSVKKKLRRKWMESDNPTLQIALYKLIAENDERKKMSTNYNEHTGEDGGDIKHSHTIENHKIIFEKYEDA